MTSRFYHSLFDVLETVATKTWDTSKYCTFLRHNEKQDYNHRARNSLHFEFLWVKKKMLAEILCSPMSGCISSGNLTRGQTSLCQCFEYQILRGGRWDWETDRRTEIKAGMETEWAVWVCSARQLVFKGLGVQNQPGNSSWALWGRVPRAPYCYHEKRSTSLRKQK